jgi:cytochrome c553
MKQMRRSLIALAASGALVAPLVAHAAGDAAAGKEKYATCAACHGADGGGQGGAFPELTGLGEERVSKALTAYREGDRDYLKSVGLGDRFGTMAPNAAGLSDEDIANLAAYVAEEFGGAAGGDAAAAGDAADTQATEAALAQADLVRGKALYSNCAICHGEQGEGGHLFGAPKLKGLPASQVASLLKVYRKGTEMGPNSYAMIPQASHLSDADINNLAAYVATIGEDVDVMQEAETE